MRPLHVLMSSLRAARRSPVHSGSIVLTLSIGLGAAGATLALAAVVWSGALPYPEGNRLVVAVPTNPDQGFDRGQGAVSWVEFKDWSRMTRVFDELAAFSSGDSGVALNLTGGSEPERVRGSFVSTNYFRVLGTSPMLGAGPDAAGNGATAVLSYALWQRRFGGDPKIVGRSIELDGRPHVIAGVMGPNFQDLRYWQEVDLWLPLPDPAGVLNPFFVDDRRARWLVGVGRLSQGVTLGAARDAFAAMAENLQQEFPENNAGWSIGIDPLGEYLYGFGALARIATALGTAALFLLLAAYGNVGALAIARAIDRRREASIKVALGADRWLRTQERIAEALVWTVPSMLVGGVLAHLILRLLTVGTGLALPAFARRELAGAAAVAIVVGGLVATLVLCGSAASQSIQRREQLSSRSRRTRAVTALLIGSQVAAATALMVIALTFGHGLLALRNVDPGHRIDDTAILQVQLPVTRYPDSDARLQLYRELLQGLRERSEITVSGLWGSSPPGQNWRYIEVVPDGRAADRPIAAFMHRTTPGAIPALGIDLVAGRDFDEQDVVGSLPVVIISAAFARAAWPGADPIGRELVVPAARGDSRPFRVIGVAEDVLHRGRSAADAGTIDAYFPLLQRTAPNIAVFARAAGADAAFDAIRSELAAIDPALPPYDLATLAERFREEEHGPTRRAALALAFAVICATLCSIGITGVILRALRAQRPEIAVRQALGATSGRILAAIAWRNGVPIASGLVAGGLAGARIAGFVPHPIGASPAIATAVIASVICAGAIGAVSLLVPARSAARRSPAEALRAS